MTYDRETFFSAVRETLFHGKLSQQQVDGMNYLLDVWEHDFDAEAGSQARNWLAYALATAFHETAYLMQPIEEYGRGSGKSYGEPTGPYLECYFGRGHVQLTWEDNYKKGEKFLKDRYKIEAPLHEYPHRMLEDETSAYILFDGMRYGWFTGVGLPKYFNDDKHDPLHARQIVNAMDKAETIASYFDKFLAALIPIDKEVMA